MGFVICMSKKKSLVNFFILLKIFHFEIISVQTKIMHNILNQEVFITQSKFFIILEINTKINII